eukprot:gnl/MRDRNA2_/MRDRNA2_78016_c0_seq1.p1 gnl/MRDRNA2_/MRDRNA2_78016_c0~~gnl/MRDRNA2_/MRDRNA2_78016_c0_seq1.p1  ORF type:complete len:405 (-),score=56.99 gnl/MRDRNA2_/MRDRNA2_78016_c0_seq1:292-1422(-)
MPSAGTIASWASLAHADWISGVDSVRIQYIVMQPVITESELHKAVNVSTINSELRVAVNGSFKELNLGWSLGNFHGMQTWQDIHLELVVAGLCNNTKPFFRALHIQDLIVSHLGLELPVEVMNNVLASNVHLVGALFRGSLPQSVGNCHSLAPAPCAEKGILYQGNYQHFVDFKAEWLSGLQSLQIHHLQVSRAGRSWSLTALAAFKSITLELFVSGESIPQQWHDLSLKVVWRGNCHQGESIATDFSVVEVSVGKMSIRANLFGQTVDTGQDISGKFAERMKQELQEDHGGLRKSLEGLRCQMQKGNDTRNQQISFIVPGDLSGMLSHGIAKRVKALIQKPLMHWGSSSKLTLEQMLNRLIDVTFSKKGRIRCPG